MLRQEFLACVGDLIGQPAVCQMEDIKQHNKNVSCLDHCIFVSYVSFWLCKKWGLDYKSAARAGLLHDLYLCNWKTTDVGPIKRLLIHPEMAAKNAEAFGISVLERDIILKHMWPVTPLKIPRYRESAVVNLADKICATAEFLGLYNLVMLRRKFVDFNLRKTAACNV